MADLHELGKAEQVGKSLYARQLLPQPKSRRTKIYWIFNSGGGAVGKVKWYAQWRRYVFAPDRDTLFDSSCLNDISLFVDTITRQRKSVRRTEKIFEDVRKKYPSLEM